jgi:hypothetical protein
VGDNLADLLLFCPVSSGQYVISAGRHRVCAFGGLCCYLAGNLIDVMV